MLSKSTQPIIRTIAIVVNRSALYVATHADAIGWITTSFDYHAGAPPLEHLVEYLRLAHSPETVRCVLVCPSGASDYDDTVLDTIRSLGYTIVPIARKNLRTLSHEEASEVLGIPSHKHPGTLKAISVLHAAGCPPGRRLGVMESVTERLRLRRERTPASSVHWCQPLDSPLTAPGPGQEAMEA